MNSFYPAPHRRPDETPRNKNQAGAANGLTSGAVGACWAVPAEFGGLRRKVSKIMPNKLNSLCFCAVALTGLATRAYGGTVITNNLPANTAIANISGTQDGAADYSGPNQASWYAPFYTGGATNLVELTLQPGGYNFRVVDPADVLALFPSLTPAQTSQIYTGWTYNSPWVTDYLVFDSAAATNNLIPQLFDGAFDTRSYTSPQAAYNGVVADGYYNVIRTGPAWPEQHELHDGLYGFSSGNADFCRAGLRLGGQRGRSLRSGVAGRAVIEHHLKRGAGDGVLGDQRGWICARTDGGTRAGRLGAVTNTPVEAGKQFGDTDHGRRFRFLPVAPPLKERA